MLSLQNITFQNSTKFTLSFIRICTKHPPRRELFEVLVTRQWGKKLHSMELKFYCEQTTNNKEVRRQVGTRAETREQTGDRWVRRHWRAQGTFQEAQRQRGSSSQVETGTRKSPSSGCSRRSGAAERTGGGGGVRPCGLLKREKYRPRAGPVAVRGRRGGRAEWREAPKVPSPRRHLRPGDVTFGVVTAVNAVL